MTILSIDIGTSRIKAALVKKDGSFLGGKSVRLDRAASPDSQDATAWYDLAAKLIRDLMREHAAPDAVSLTGNMHALLGVDTTGRPTADALLWSDHSAEAESNELNTRYGAHLTQEFGNVAIPVFTLPKLLRMKKIAPDSYARATAFLQSKDYVGYRLTGVFATDPSDASGTLLMRLADRSWSHGLIEELGLDATKLPPILSSDAIRGTITRAAAQETGLPQGTPVITGCGDLASAALGSAVDADSLSLTLGTAGQLLAAGKPGEGQALAGKLFVFAHADPSLELYLGSVPSGGFSFEWLAKTHRLTMEEFFTLAASVPTRESLPVFLPYLLGRGAPYMDYTPNASWHGIDAGHTVADLCRAAVLGTLCPLRQCADLLEQLSGRRRERILFQALADREQAVRESAAALFPQKAYRSNTSEASLLGAAILGATALGIYPDVAAATRAMVHTEPMMRDADGDRAAADALYRKFRRWAG